MTFGFNQVVLPVLSNTDSGNQRTRFVNDMKPPARHDGGLEGIKENEEDKQNGAGKPNQPAPS